MNLAGSSRGTYARFNSWEDEPFKDDATGNAGPTRYDTSGA